MRPLFPSRSWRRKTLTVGLLVHEAGSKPVPTEAEVQILGAELAAEMAGWMLRVPPPTEAETEAMEAKILAIPAVAALNHAAQTHQAAWFRWRKVRDL